MTGRELIIYIMENGLENEEIFKNGRIIGFMNENEAAQKFDVGIETVRLWVKMEIIKGIQIGTMCYIPANVKDPREAICTKQKH